MTREEKREQILKRALPALFITIIYFIFISHIMGDQAKKVQEEYVSLIRKGISPAAVPGLYRQTEQVRGQLATLQAKQAKYVTQIESMAGFLAGKADTTEASKVLANLLAKHHLRVTKELSETFLVKDLPASLAEVRTLLQASLQSGENISVQHLWLQGRFQSMYAALAEMNEAQLAVIPVLFTLSIPEDAQEGDLLWEFVLWM